MEIAIITHDSQTALSAFFQRLTASESSYKIHVIDNLSTDQTTQVAKSANANLVETGANLGYGRATNVALNLCQSKFLLLLNPDVVPTPEALAKIQALTTDESFFAEKYAILSFRVFDYRADGVTKNYYKYCAHPNQNSAFTESVFVTGAAMLLNVEYIKQIGMFDENIFLFYEETDLCKRAINAGYKVGYANNIDIEHSAGRSSPPTLRYLRIKYFHFGWSRAYYTKKHLKNASVENLSFTLKYVFKALLYFITCKKSKFIKYFYQSQGILSYLIGLKAFNDKGIARKTEYPK